MSLGKDPVMAIAVVSENLWCSCGNKLFIISHDEEVIKVGKHVNVYKVLGENMVHRRGLEPRSPVFKADVITATPQANLQWKWRVGSLLRLTEK